MLGDAEAKIRARGSTFDDGTGYIEVEGGDEDQCAVQNEKASSGPNVGHDEDLHVFMECNADGGWPVTNVDDDEDVCGGVGGERVLRVGPVVSALEKRLS